MIIIITAASKGIGFAIAAEFVKNSNHTLIICSKQKQHLELATHSLQKINFNTKIYSKIVDLANHDEIKGFAAFCLEIGIPDVLINNVGVFKPNSILEEKTADLLDTFNVNVVSPYVLTQQLISSMIKQKKGHIINICSVASFKGFENFCNYNISKFALLGFGKYLREELKKFNIKVTNVLPGATLTDSWDASTLSPNRILDPSDIAKMVYALVCLSDQAVVEDIIIRPTLGDL